MDFIVKFTTKDDGKQLLDKMGNVGIDMLDSIRELYPELKNIDIENIDIFNSCPINGHQHCIYLDEDTARQSGMFHGKLYITIKVPEFFFSRFVKMKKIDKTSFTFENEIYYKFKFWIIKPFKKYVTLSKGYIKGAKIVHEIDDNDIINYWKEKGFPIEMEY